MGQKLRAKHQLNKFFTISMIIVFYLINDSEGCDVLLFSDLCLKMLAVQVDMH